MCNTYDINGTFLDYQSLIRKIPNNWKNIIINNRQVCRLNIMLHVISMFNICLKINGAVEHFMTS